MSIIQQLEDLKEWSQDSTRYERRLAFRGNLPSTEAGTIPIEWDELSDREREYYRTGPWSTREDYRKGQLVQPGPGRQGFQWGSSYKKSKGDVWDRKTKEWRKPRYVSADHADEANKVINNYKKFVAKNYSMKGDLKGAPALDTYLTNKYGKVEAKNLTYKIGKFTNFEPRSYLQEQKLNLAEGLVNKLNTNLKFFEGGKKGILNKVGSIGVRPDVNEFTTKLHKILDGLDSREKKVVKGLNYIVDSDLPLKSADRGLVNRQGVLRSMIFDLTGVDTGAEAFTTGIKKASRQVAKKLNITPKEFEDTFKYLNRTARKNSNLINVPFNQAFEFGSQRLKGAAELGGRDFLQFYRDPNTNIMNYIFRHWDRNNFSGTNSRVKLFDRSKVKLVDGNLVPKKGYTLKDIELEWKSGKKYKVGEFAFSYDGKQLFDVTTLRTKGKESGLFDEVYKATNDYYKLYNRKIPDPKNPGKTIDFGEMMTRDHGKNSMAIGHNAPGGIKTQPLKNFQIQSQKMNTAIYQATKHIQNKDLQKRVLQNIYGDLKNLKGDKYLEAFVKNPPSTTYREAGQKIVKDPVFKTFSPKKQREALRIAGDKIMQSYQANGIGKNCKAYGGRVGFQEAGAVGVSQCMRNAIQEHNRKVQEGDLPALKKQLKINQTKPMKNILKLGGRGLRALTSIIGGYGGAAIEAAAEAAFVAYGKRQGETDEQARENLFLPKVAAWAVGDKAWEKLGFEPFKTGVWEGPEKLIEEELVAGNELAQEYQQGIQALEDEYANASKIDFELGIMKNARRPAAPEDIEIKEQELRDSYGRIEELQINIKEGTPKHAAYVAAQEKQKAAQDARAQEHWGDTPGYRSSKQKQWQDEFLDYRGADRKFRKQEPFAFKGGVEANVGLTQDQLEQGMRIPWEEYFPRTIDTPRTTEQQKWDYIMNQGGWDLTDKISAAGGVANMARGGIAGIRRPWAIPPESGPMPQGGGLSSQFNRVKKLTG